MFLKIRVYVIAATHLLIVTTAGCGNSNDGDDRYGKYTVDYIPIEEVVQAPVSVDELDAAFSRDYPPDIEYALNEVKQSRLSYEVTKLVACAYTECDAKSDKWHSVIFENSLVRVNLLDVLVQARSQGIDLSDEQDFRKDAILFLVDENPFVVQRAIMVLAYIGDPRDISSLEDVAQTTRDDTTYRVAIFALKLMGTDQANEAIRRVLDSSDERRRFMLEDFIE